MKKMYGWDYIVKFKALNPKLGRSVNTVVPTLVSGERALGVAPLARALTRKQLGDPIDFQYPEEGLVTIISPISILKKAPHPNAAKLFMNFLNSKEYAEVVTKYYENSLRSDVEIKGVKSIADLKTYTLTPTEIETGILTVKKEWRNLFGA